MGLLGLFSQKKVLASVVGETVAAGLWQEWDDPAYLRSFCDGLKHDARSDRILLVLGASRLFVFAVCQTYNRLGLDTESAHIISRNLVKHLALAGTARGYWDDPASAIDSMSDLAERLFTVWVESEGKPAGPAWYVSKAMIEALTGAPPAETDPEPVIRMYPYAHPGASCLLAFFDHLRGQGYLVVPG